MARIRTLKPEFWDSPSTAQADLAVRLTFMAMWNWADDSGHGTANLKELEAFCFPNDEVAELPRRGRGNSAGAAGTWRSFAEVCGEVADVYGVVFYRVNGRPYYWIPSFKQHQSKDYRATSRYPGVEEGEPYDVTSGNALREGARDSPENSSRGNSAGTAGGSAGSAGNAALGTGEQGNRGTGEQGNSSSEIASDPEREDVTALLDLLDREIEANGNRPPKRSKANRDAMRLLLDRDHRTPEQVAYVIRWCQADDFWQANILSAVKLREKFDQLVAKIRSQHERRNQPTEKEQRNRDILDAFAAEDDEPEELFVEGIPA